MENMEEVKKNLKCLKGVNMAKLLTNDQEAFLYKNYIGIGNEVLLEKLNKEFNLEITLKQIKSWKKNRKLNSGLTGRFPKGNVPFNKNKKFPGKTNVTTFKKGHIPKNYMPVGSERINGGYVDIKIADPNKWKAKHKIIWENTNGKIPKGHCVIFADRNNLNFELDNLILVSRKQLLELNGSKLIQEDKELTKTAINIVDLKIKISDMKKSIRGNNKDCF